MFGNVASKRTLGASLLSRKAMLETLFRHLDMVRLSVGALLVLAAMGCTGLVDSGSDGLTAQQRRAREMWQEQAFPILSNACVTCHNGSRAQVGFLIGGEDLEIRENLLAFERSIVNLEAPSSSQLLTKGIHDGPALTPDQSGTVLEWIQSERAGEQSRPDKPGEEQLATPAFAIQLCTAGLPDNPEGTCPTSRVALSTVPTAGSNIPGAEITFTAQSLAGGLYMSNLKLVGGTAGTFIDHPLFVSRPKEGAPVPDKIDRYYNLKLNLMANGSEQLAGGTAMFAGFSPTDELEVHFKVLSAFKPETGGGGGGECKAFAQFQANAVAQLQARCASCHAGADQRAKGAMDITGFNAADPATQAAACAQVRSRINLTNTDQSGFYLAPAPGAGNHPLKLNQADFDTFKAALNVWVLAEKTAP